MYAIFLNVLQLSYCEKQAQTKLVYNIEGADILWKYWQWNLLFEWPISVTAAENILFGS